MSRNVKICCVTLERPVGPRPVKEHMAYAMEMLEKALAYGPDLIVLPESYPTFESTPEETAWAAANTDALNEEVAKRAHKGNCYIVNPILEKNPDGDNVFNTAYVLNRKGSVCLRYRKTHLAAFEHFAYGAIPGDEFPVLDADFGKMAVMLCMDLHFPEVTRILAGKGAELVCMPTQSYAPGQDMLLTLLRTRAFDSQIYLACANFVQEPYFPGNHIGRSCVIAPDGILRADTGSHSGFAITEVDLDWLPPISWAYTDSEAELAKLYPNWRAVLNAFRRPEIYHHLTEKGE